MKQLVERSGAVAGLGENAGAFTPWTDWHEVSRPERARVADAAEQPPCVRFPTPRPRGACRSHPTVPAAQHFLLQTLRAHSPFLS